MISDPKSQIAAMTNQALGGPISCEMTGRSLCERVGSESKQNCSTISSTMAEACCEACTKVAADQAVATAPVCKDNSTLLGHYLNTMTGFRFQFSQIQCTHLYQMISDPKSQIAAMTNQALGGPVSCEMTGRSLCERVGSESKQNCSTISSTMAEVCCEACTKVAADQAVAAAP